MGVIKLKPNLCTTYIKLYKDFGKRDRERQKRLLPLNINTTILKSKLLSSITRIDPSFPICQDISETSKFHMDYNFYSEVLLGDAYRKHILIIFAVGSWNFGKLQELFSKFE